jgi:hypothetical protein
MGASLISVLLLSHCTKDSNLLFQRKATLAPLSGIAAYHTLLELALN